MSPELCGVIWEHLTPDSICQAVPKGFWLYLSKKCLYPCQTGTETQRETYIAQLPTLTLADHSSQASGELTRKVSGYSTAPK